MFNLYEIMQNAQGGEAVQNLARQFNISPGQADAAVKAFMTPLSTGFMAKAAEPFGFGALFGAMGDGQHRAAFDDPNAARAAETANKGNDVLGQVFGSQAAQDLAQRISAATGISPETLNQMLPVMTSMILGGLTNALEKQGFGGIFGQFTNAFQQGGAAWSSILGQMFGGTQVPGGFAGPTQAPGQAGAGGFGGIFGNMIGSFFGGHNPAAQGQAQQGQQAASASGMPPMSGFDPANWQAGLDALNKMFQPGVPSGGPGASNLESEISGIMNGKAR